MCAQRRPPREVTAGLGSWRARLSQLPGARRTEPAHGARAGRTCQREKHPLPGHAGPAGRKGRPDWCGRPRLRVRPSELRFQKLPVHLPIQDSLVLEPAPLTESGLQRSWWPAPGFQAGLPVDPPRQSLPGAEPLAPGAPSSPVKFCADSVQRCRWQRGRRQPRRESLAKCSSERGPEAFGS